MRPLILTEAKALLQLVLVRRREVCPFQVQVPFVVVFRHCNCKQWSFFGKWWDAIYWVPLVESRFSQAGHHPDLCDNTLAQVSWKCHYDCLFMCHCSVVAQLLPRPMVNLWHLHLWLRDNYTYWWLNICCLHCWLNIQVLAPGLNIWSSVSVIWNQRKVVDRYVETGGYYIPFEIMWESYICWILCLTARYK
jgi:hypothetical protein